MQKTQPFLPWILGLLMAACGSKASFTASTGSKPEPPPPVQSEDALPEETAEDETSPEPEPEPELPPPTEIVETRGETIRAALHPPTEKQQIWVITRAGHIHLLELEKDRVVNEKKWMWRPGHGARTYVTEGGLVASRVKGQLLFVDPLGTPEGTIDLSPEAGWFHQLPDGPDRARITYPDGRHFATRGCVVSYRREGGRFLGMGYGHGRFAEIRLHDEPPYAPDWSSLNDTVPSGGPGSQAWGYSCFIDQKRMIFYSQMFHGDGLGSTMALDLNGPPGPDSKAAMETAIAHAPNAIFRSGNLGGTTLGVVRPDTPGGAYAMSGDPDGNLLNGQSFYTMAYEPVSKTVWGTDGNTLHIFPAACLSTKKNCTNHASYDTSTRELGGVTFGPLSALNNGFMVAISRGDRSQVYLLRLSDSADPGSGLKSKRLKGVEGDAYMYTDFTGATLYQTKSVARVDMADDPQFEPSLPVSRVTFRWTSEDPAVTRLTGVRLEARCFPGDEKAGEWQVVSDVAGREEETPLAVPSCSKRQFSKIDIRLIQTDARETLRNIRALEVSTWQEKEVQISP